MPTFWATDSPITSIIMHYRELLFSRLTSNDSFKTRSIVDDVFIIRLMLKSTTTTIQYNTIQYKNWMNAQNVAIQCRQESEKVMGRKKWQMLETPREEKRLTFTLTPIEARKKNPMWKIKLKMLEWLMITMTDEILTHWLLCSVQQCKHILVFVNISFEWAKKEPRGRTLYLYKSISIATCSSQHQIIIARAKTQPMNP